MVLLGFMWGLYVNLFWPCFWRGPIAWRKPPTCLLYTAQETLRRHNAKGINLSLGALGAPSAKNVPQMKHWAIKPSTQTL